MMQEQEVSTKPKRLYLNRLAQFLLLSLICLMLGLTDGIRSYVSSYHNGIFYGDLYILIRWDMSAWLFWIPLIPIIFWLSNRFPLNQKSWQLGLFLYLPLGIIAALGKTFFPVIIGISLEGLAHVSEWLPGKFYFLVTDFIFALVFYSFVLAFGQAMNYYKQFREEELRSSQLELQLSKAQLQALKMQLHPHFLFNALNSISALQMENGEEAQKMTAKLGDFLRMTLENVGVQDVSLGREIEFLKCYLDIEKVRFGSRLKTAIRVAPEARDCRLPNLILQPLVENAIRHGIAPQAADGQIEINANRENGWLKVVIEDNGRGLKNKNIDDIFSSGIGLSNTRSRLNQIYGENFRFDIESQSERGLRVTLCFPVEPNNEN